MSTTLWSNCSPIPFPVRKLRLAIDFLHICLVFSLSNVVLFKFHSEKKGIEDEEMYHMFDSVIKFFHDHVPHHESHFHARRGSLIFTLYHSI